MAKTTKTLRMATVLDKSGQKRTKLTKMDLKEQSRQRNEMD